MKWGEDIPRVTVEGVSHPVALWCVEERCRCGKQAAHKVEETTGHPNMHPFTAYLCCDHFRENIGWCSQAPTEVEPIYCCDEVKSHYEEYGTWRGGSHYHCGRCNKLSSMMGHYTSICRNKPTRNGKLFRNSEPHFCCPGDCGLNDA